MPAIVLPHVIAGTNASRIQFDTEQSAFGAACLAYQLDNPDNRQNATLALGDEYPYEDSRGRALSYRMLYADGIETQWMIMLMVSGAYLVDCMP